MPAPSDLARRPLRLLIALLIGLLVATTAMAQAPRAPQAPVSELSQRWDVLAAEAEAKVAEAETSTEALEALRERLVAQRSEALAIEQENQPAVDELNQRLTALGPPPAEGAEEAPEIEAMRRDLQQQIADALVPVQTAQEAYRRANTIIQTIDRTIRYRFSAELRSRSESPLSPGVWRTAVGEIAASLDAYFTAVERDFRNPDDGRIKLGRLPFQLGLMLAGLAVAITLRRQLVGWVERRLAEAGDPRSVAWLVALRNLARLVVPAVGAGLFFAAFDPAGLLVRADQGRFFALPPFVLVLIGAGWLAGSLFSPANVDIGLLPVDKQEAWYGTKVVFALAIAISLSLAFGSLALQWNLSTTTQGALQFVPVVIGALALWRAAALAEAIYVHALESATPAAGDSATLTTIGMRLLRLLIRVVRIVAVVGPMLGAIGYVPAASFLVLRTALTLGLLGAVHLVFDLLNKTVRVLVSGRRPGPQDDSASLVPVAVGAVVGLTALPVLALTWGVRPSEIADFWVMLRDGVTLGGIRLSASAVVTLVVVFALGFALTRLLQTILRGTVLPRTRLDAGGRNAVLAGVGYIGFATAGLVAVAAAGLDLSSLAIVAGALSVGIGFGLQTIVSNFVSGIILLVERPVKEGDWIEVGGFSGYVKGINVRSTEIETFDRASVILPNSDLVAGTVLNRTHSGMSGRLQVPVSVTYDGDPRRVEAILLEIAEAHPLVVEDPEPLVLFLDLGADTMNFELRCWLRDVNFMLSVRSDMNFEIAERFAKEGIRTRFYGREVPPDRAAQRPDPNTQPDLQAPEQEAAT